MEKTTAKAFGRDLPISTKKSIEVCNFIRNRTLERAKEILNQTISMEKAIPFRRFKRDLGHKRKIGPGRYPVKTCIEILKIVNAAEANAVHKGLSGDLKIVHISAQKGSGAWHFGRKRRRRMKKTHIEIVVEEIEVKERKKQEKVKKGKERIQKKEKTRKSEEKNNKK